MMAIEQNVVKDTLALSVDFFHVAIFHRFIKIHCSKMSPIIVRWFVAEYFPQTLEALRRRNLDILVELPEVEFKSPNVAQSWVHYDYV